MGKAWENVENFRLNRDWKRPLERWKSRSGTNAKIDHKEVGGDIENGISLASIANSLHVAPNTTVINLAFSCLELPDFLLPFAVNTSNDSHSHITSNSESILQHVELQKQLPLCYSVIYDDYKRSVTLTLYSCFLSVRSTVLISACRPISLAKVLRK